MLYCHGVVFILVLIQSFGGFDLFKAKAGIMMNIIGILCVTLAINTWGKAMFHLDSFPAWANSTGL